MTVLQAKSCTGARITTNVLSESMIVWTAFSEYGDVLAKVRGSDEREAMRQLVNEVYRRRCSEAMTDADWRCTICGALVPLENHHKKHRSKGRDDRKENLEPRCSRHHAKAHGG